MKIQRTIKGKTEYLAARPLSVLGEDGKTIDHVETAWTDDESEAFDFGPVTPTAAHARDLAKQLEGFGAVMPSEFEALPEPAPKTVPAARPAPKVEKRDTTEGVALRERLAAEKAAREAERAAREAAEAQADQ